MSLSNTCDISPRRYWCATRFAAPSFYQSSWKLWFFYFKRFSRLYLVLKRLGKCYSLFYIDRVKFTLKLHIVIDQYQWLIDKIVISVKLQRYISLYYLKMIYINKYLLKFYVFALNLILTRDRYHKTMNLRVSS